MLVLSSSRIVGLSCYCLFRVLSSLLNVLNVVLFSLIWLSMNNVVSITVFLLWMFLLLILLSLSLTSFLR